MARAVQLARHGNYTTHPNPRVGCVVVQQDDVIGEGWHLCAGEPHAEIKALRDVEANGKRADGATVYVTLEPCSHHGRTPPCANALIKAGVRRVVIAMRDPSPKVAGQGSARLKAAGIEVTEGVLQAEAEALNPGFISRFVRRRPFVRCKLAMSLDGRTAMASGESKWITSSAARQDVQRLRARCDAIMTGIGTVLADDPQLNVRAAGVAGLEAIVDNDSYRQPLRVIVDSRLKSPVTSRAVTAPGRALIATTAAVTDRQLKAFGDQGATVRQYAANGGRIDLTTVLKDLAEQEINEVLLEAGPMLCGAMMQAGLIDELIVYMAPHLMGDAGRGLMTFIGVDNMAQRIALKMIDVRAVGNDLRLTFYPESR